jgi:eukaryotic-like serine/threonine-protein kinase
MPQPRCCPTAVELTAFLVGDLPEGELDEVAGHLESCPTCEAAARALDGVADPRLTPFRSAARAGAAPEAPLPGRVGDYEILDEVGRGGMGVVYRARHAQLRRVVALKVLRGGAFADPEERRRFRAEAEAVARLQHPNIVQIFDVGEWRPPDGSPPVPYFALEFVGGGNLAARSAGRPQPPRQAAAWLEPLAWAVHYAHQQGIVHRDLKPANVLLTQDGQPKLCDFGVAKLLEGGDAPTRSGLVIGTAEYMAPEQAEKARGAVGPAADVYALGAMLYELLTGRPPFDGLNALDVVRRLLGEEVLSPSRLQPGIPRDLVTVCLKCLEKEPARRYPTAGELAEDLRRFVAGEPIRARRVGVAGRGWRWCRRQPLLAGLVAALALSLAGGLAGMTALWLQAGAARDVAVREKDTADTERGKALQFAADLRVQRDAAEWHAYRANIAAAMTALQLRNLAPARQYLEDAPGKHRNWEWWYLASQLDHKHRPLRGHEGKVYALAFSPDGRLASGSADRTVRLWDTEGREVAVLRDHQEPVWRVVFSPDGRRLASADGVGTARLWDAEGRALAVLPGRLADPGSLTFSPDSRLLGGHSGQNCTVYLWDATTGAPRHVLRHRSSGIEWIAFSPDGKRLISAGSDGSLNVWDAASGAFRLAWQAHSARVMKIDFSPDGTRVASGADYPDNTVRLWDADTGRELATLVGHRNMVNNLVFSPDGTRLISASWDQTARLWDVGTGLPLATLQGHRARVTDAIFRPNGAQAVTRGDDRTLHVWDARTGVLLTVLGGTAGLAGDRGLAFSPDGTRLACASDDGTVWLWDMELVERNGVLRGHTGYVYDVAFSPDGTRVASAAWDGTVRIWDATTQRQTGPPLQHDGEVISSVAFSPDGQQLLSVRRGRLYLWDLATGKPRHVWPESPTDDTDTRAAFHPSGLLVAAGAEDASARLWDARSGQAVAVLGAGRGSCLDVAFSPDGARLASAERDGTVRLWDVATGELVGVLPGHTGVVYSVRFSADGGLIASAGLDTTARLWDATTHKELAVLPHGGSVYGLAFTRDGTRLATACRDNTIRLWDVASHEEVAELRGHEDYVHAIAFSPDGTRLVSGSGDHTVRIWDTLSPQRGIREQEEVGRETGK